MSDTTGRTPQVDLFTIGGAMVDLSTLLFALTLSGLVLGASTLLVAARTEHSPGLATWGWALIINAASYVAFGVRLLGWPTVSIITSNVLTPLSMALYILALMQFHRDPPSRTTRVLLWFPVLVGLLAGSLLLEQHETRILIITLMHTYLSLMMAWVAWRPPKGTPRLAGHLLIMAGALAVAMMFLWRAAITLGNTHWSQPLFVPPQVQTATYVTVFVALLVNTMGFVLMRMERALHRERDLATHDALTGTLNRRELLRVIGRLISRARRVGQPMSVLMIDIDHFKWVNDKFGHATGDVVLREVASRLEARLRRYDVLARYGGEEFVVALPATGEQQALTVAESLRSNVADDVFAIPGQAEPIAITVSIGVHTRVPCDEPGESDLMIAASDRALYRAKSNGRNRVEAQAD